MVENDGRLIIYCGRHAGKTTAHRMTLRAIYAKMVMQGRGHMFCGPTITSVIYDD